MADIAKSRTFMVKTLLTKAATRAKVTTEISKAASTLKAGDIFMLSYSGHGGQLPDLNRDEPDAQDETWCLYNGELVDDELYGLFGKFKRGVRILVFSDSCHSGTVVKMAYYQGTTTARGSAISSQGVKYRFMPPDVALRTYRNNRKFYDPILKKAKQKDTKAVVKASVLLVSGCQDNQLSADGDFNGLFTAQLLRVWKNGTFKGNYGRFHASIVRLSNSEEISIGCLWLSADTQTPGAVGLIYELFIEEPFRRSGIANQMPCANLRKKHHFLGSEALHFTFSDTTRLQEICIKSSVMKSRISESLNPFLKTKNGNSLCF